MKKIFRVINWIRTTIFCGHCGTENPITNIHCLKCGKKLPFH